MTTAEREHLTTGWEPDVPADDTLLRRYLFAWAAQCEAFVGAAGGVTERTDRWARADLGRPTGLFDAVTLLAPLPADDPGPVLGEVEGRAAGGRGELHLWSAWPTPDLRDRGWRLVGHPPLLIRPPARHLPPPPAPPVDLRRVHDADGLAEWERVVVEGYPLEELLPYRRAALAAPALLDDPRLRFTIGREGDRVVSVGTLFTHEDLGIFAMGVTEPDVRGRGHWRAHAVDRLLAAPDLWMAGVFSDFSRPPAEALGFVPITRFTLWALDRP